MADDNHFADLIHRIRAGDDQAASALVREYEPVIRLAVRLRLRDARLRRVFDSMDICQSVLTSFFLRASLGQYDLDQPEQLVRLLVSLARNKVAYQVRKQRSQRRDHRRMEAVAVDEWEVAAIDPGPSQIVAGRELFQVFRQRLTAEERQLADRRGDGRSWAEIAGEVGGTAQGRRMQLARAVQRVAEELGVDR